MEWLVFFCLTFQLACCCGTAACSLCCKCCPKIKQSTSTRFMYALYFMLVTIICCVMMSTTVANEMKMHVSKRDDTAAPARKWGSFHSSFCTGALPQKGRSVLSTHPLLNPNRMICAQLLPVSCSPVEWFHNRKNWGSQDSQPSSFFIVQKPSAVNPSQICCVGSVTRAC